MTRLIPALVLLICITACKKDKDKEEDASLVGKWKQTQYFDGRIPSGCQCWSRVNEMSKYKVEFKSDGTHLMTPPLYSAMAYCTAPYRVINDTTLSLTYGCGATPVETTHSFSIEGNTLIIAFDPPGYSYKIKFKKVDSF